MPLLGHARNHDRNRNRKDSSVFLPHLCWLDCSVRCRTCRGLPFLLLRTPNGSTAQLPTTCTIHNRCFHTRLHLATSMPEPHRAPHLLYPTTPFRAPAPRPPLPALHPKPASVAPLSLPYTPAVPICSTTVPRPAQVFQCGAGLEDEEPLAAAGLPPALRTFDLVVANILRGPLIELRERLTG